MTAKIARPYVEVPTTILGVIIGTHVINPHEEDEEAKPLGGYFGFIPNDKGARILGADVVSAIQKANAECIRRDTWSLNINNESGGISFVRDSEDGDEESDDEEEGPYGFEGEVLHMDGSDFPDDEVPDGAINPLSPGEIRKPDIDWSKLFSD